MPKENSPVILVPCRLMNGIGFTFTFHGDLVEYACILPVIRAQVLPGVIGQHDLASLGYGDDTGCNINSITKRLVVMLTGHAGMKTDSDMQPVTLLVAQSLLNITGGRKGSIRVVERTHNFIANNLDDPAMILLNYHKQQLLEFPYLLVGLNISQP